MADYTYYYQFLDPNDSQGVYKTQYLSGRMRANASRTWKQGPKGGVQIIQEYWLMPSRERLGHGYKTTDPRAMKEFTFVKLQAKDYKV